MKPLLKLIITLLVAYLIYRLLTEFLRPVSVRLDEQPDLFPSYAETEPPLSPVQLPARNDVTANQVNVNEADATTLTSLPGVGPALAERIVAYRETSGPFKDPDDLANVSGVGTVLVERLRSLMSV